MFATLKLVNAYFWKTYYGPAFSLIFPLLMLAILGNILRIEYVYPGIIALSTMFVGILSMPLLMSELKQSSLFKYIGTTSLTPFKFIAVMICYFFVVALLSTTFLLIMTMAFFSKKVFPHGGYNQGIFSGLGTSTGALSFIFSWALHFIFSVAIGVLMFSLISSGQHMAVIAFAIAIPSMFLSGMILSVDIIAQSNVMQWLSRFDPFRYTTGNLVVSATPRNQLGDLFQTLTTSDKRMIFNFKDVPTITDWNGNAGHFFILENSTGNIVVYHYENSTKIVDVTITDVPSLKNFFSQLSEQSKKRVLWDLTLYKLLFESDVPIVASSNNVFSFKEWGVRKIPDITVIRNFVMNYFKGESGTGGDQSRFDGIWKHIQNGEFDWLDVFLKQNMLLYFKGDKIANLLVPTFLSSGFIFTARRNFSWK